MWSFVFYFSPSRLPPFFSPTSVLYIFTCSLVVFCWLWRTNTPPRGEFDLVSPTKPPSRPPPPPSPRYLIRLTLLWWKFTLTVGTDGPHFPRPNPKTGSFPLIFYVPRTGEASWPHFYLPVAILYSIHFFVPLPFPLSSPGPLTVFLFPN